MKEARSLIWASVALDPEYAKAYVGLGWIPLFYWAEGDTFLA